MAEKQKTDISAAIWRGLGGAVIGMLVGSFIGFAFGNALIGVMILSPLCAWLTYTFGFNSKGKK